ncbi:MAG: hypothetical protein IKO57_09130 [Treponema sp.]|nr:hypothetical protein [Treponema sp.]
MKNLRNILTVLALFVLSVLFSSCSDKFADIEIDGTINYGTGQYGQVNYIEYSVTGGEGPYKIYYARSIDDWDYAKSQRGYVGEVEEGVTYRLTPSGTNYVSVGWYYYIWAVDENGASGGARWHP